MDNAASAKVIDSCCGWRMHCIYTDMTETDFDTFNCELITDFSQPCSIITVIQSIVLQLDIRYDKL